MFVLLYFLIIGFVKILTFLVLFFGTVAVMYAIGRGVEKAGQSIEYFIFI